MFFKDSKYDEYSKNMTKEYFRDGENILTLPKASVKQLNLFCSFIFCSKSSL